MARLRNEEIVYWEPKNLELVREVMKDRLWYLDVLRRFYKNNFYIDDYFQSWCINIGKYGFKGIELESNKTRRRNLFCGLLLRHAKGVSKYRQYYKVSTAVDAITTDAYENIVANKVSPDTGDLVYQLEYVIEACQKKYKGKKMQTDSLDFFVNGPRGPGRWKPGNGPGDKAADVKQFIQNAFIWV